MQGAPAGVDPSAHGVPVLGLDGGGDIGDVEGDRRRAGVGEGLAAQLHGGSVGLGDVLENDVEHGTGREAGPGGVGDGTVQFPEEGPREPGRSRTHGENEGGIAQFVDLQLGGAWLSSERIRIRQKHGVGAHLPGHLTRGRTQEQCGAVGAEEDAVPADSGGPRRCVPLRQDGPGSDQEILTKCGFLFRRRLLGTAELHCHGRGQAGGEQHRAGVAFHATLIVLRRSLTRSSASVFACTSAAVMPGAVSVSNRPRSVTSMTASSVMMRCTTL